MTEAEVYQYLTKDGDSLGTIKKNTEMLRQYFSTEAERVTHSLAQLDPHNKDRHAAEAQKIFQESNIVLDRVLMQIASTSPQELPLPIEAMNKASSITQVPKNQAKAILALPLILIAAIPAALLYSIVVIGTIWIVSFFAETLNRFTLKMDMSFIFDNFTAPNILLFIKVLCGSCYVFLVFQGFRSIRSGGTVWSVINDFFFQPIFALTGSSGGKR